MVLASKKGMGIHNYPDQIPVKFNIKGSHATLEETVFWQIKRGWEYRKEIAPEIGYPSQFGGTTLG